MDVDEARARLTVLRDRLAEMVHRDADHEVGRFAIPVLDEVINGARDLCKPGDVVGAVLRDIISPEAVADGLADEPLSASAVIYVVDQLLISLPAERKPDIDLLVGDRRRHEVDFMTVEM